ncbi:MAG: RimK family alpha-L-glutamate ligase [Clostridia bacterium]|nr:RimK family alpha-L-glutamate ligase [Clostridia bacterium]
MAKSGWLIVNGFLRTEKFAELYALLQNAANARGVSLQCKTACSLTLAFGEETRIDKPDFVLFWDKDEVLARRLEALQIPVFNGASAIAVCDNKILTAEALVRCGVKAPKTIPAPKTFEGVGYTDLAFLDEAERALGYPMVIKEAYGSFGAQVYLVSDRAEACAIIEKIAWKPFLLQEFIAESRGRDIRVNIVGGKAVCAMLRVNGRDFRSNITGGGRARKLLLTKAQAEAAVAACRAVGADFAGVDLLLGKDGPLVCEVNSSPHFKSTLDCTGVDLSGHILDYILERV